MEQTKSKLGIGFILITGAGDFATEAAQAVRDYGFGDLRLPRVISLIHPDNLPSRRVAEKNAMKLEWETVFKGFPTQVFALSREQWLAEHACE